MSGLPGAVSRYDLHALRAALGTHAGLTPGDLRANLARFLHAVIPAATELGLRLCIHPDDPPRDILGLPRIVSTRQDIAWILDAMDSPCNGLTLCTGSPGSRQGSDVAGIAHAFADRIHFAHLRNVRTEPEGAFRKPPISTAMSILWRWSTACWRRRRCATSICRFGPIPGMRCWWTRRWTASRGTHWPVTFGGLPCSGA
jgi:D-mannonate dehydratase